MATPSPPNLGPVELLQRFLGGIINQPPLGDPAVPHEGRLYSDPCVLYLLCAVNPR